MRTARNFWALAREDEEDRGFPTPRGGWYICTADGIWGKGKREEFYHDSHHKRAFGG